MSVNFQFTSHVDELKNALPDAIERALEAVGMQAADNVADLAPVDTGRLKASITHQVDVNEQCVYIGTNVEYAAYVEMGTSKMKAQPYLQPGIMNNVDEYKAIAENYLSQ